MQKSRIFASKNLQNDVHKALTPNQPAVDVFQPEAAIEPEASAISIGQKDRLGFHRRGILVILLRQLFETII